MNTAARFNVGDLVYTDRINRIVLIFEQDPVEWYRGSDNEYARGLYFDAVSGYDVIDFYVQNAHLIQATDE